MMQPATQQHEFPIDDPSTSQAEVACIVITATDPPLPYCIVYPYSAN